MTEQPVPCDWCGNVPAVERGAGYDWTVECQCETCPVGPSTVGIRGPDNAVRVWNTRATPSPEPPSADAVLVARSAANEIAAFLDATTPLSVGSPTVEKFQSILEKHVRPALTTAQAKQREVDAGIAENFRQRIVYEIDEGLREAAFGDMVITIERNPSKERLS